MFCFKTIIVINDFKSCYEFKNVQVNKNNTYMFFAFWINLKKSYFVYLGNVMENYWVAILLFISNDYCLDLSCNLIKYFVFKQAFGLES